jgi:uncharacterized protein (TIGR00369 family)
MEKIPSPFENFLGMYVVEEKEGACTIGLGFKKELTNFHGNFHGGVIASIIDTAAVQALRTLCAEGPFLTVGLEIRYKKPTMSSEIFAKAQAKQLRGKFFETEVSVIDKENNTVAQGQVKSLVPNYVESK